MKFVADVMLGALARRLRLLGYDVAYDPRADDTEILRRSLSEDRLILTRDLALSHRPLAKNHLFIESQDLEEQVAQVLSRHHPAAGAHALTRCSRCNRMLDGIPREEAKDLVPEHVYRSHSSFLRCEGCGRIYWRGTHVEHMRLEDQREG